MSRGMSDQIELRANVRREDGMYWAEVPSHPGLFASGETIAIAAHEVQKPVFFARVIIIVSYLPIFTLQRVEGRLFSPMAWTVAFALLGALIGMACAWLLVHGKRGIVVSTTFQFSLTAHFVLVGFAWAIVIALAGSILPALRAVRLPITAGLRA